MAYITDDSQSSKFQELNIEYKTYGKNDSVFKKSVSVENWEDYNPYKGYMISDVRPVFFDTTTVMEIPANIVREHKFRWRNQFGGAYATMLAADFPMNVFYGYVTDGVFQTADEIRAHAVQPGAEPGDIRFRDLNNDGVINDDDRTVIGNPNPTWLFSMNNRFTYKGFELSIFLQGVAGNKIYNRTRSARESMSAAYNQYASTADRWTGPGTSDRKSTRLNSSHQD